VSGQLALATGEQIVAAAVWETLPVECQQRVVLKLASLLAALIEAEREDLRRMRRERAYTTATLREIERELDLDESRLRARIRL